MSSGYWQVQEGHKMLDARNAQDLAGKHQAWSWADSVQQFGRLGNKAWKS